MKHFILGKAKPHKYIQRKGAPRQYHYIYPGDVALKHRLDIAYQTLKKPGATAGTVGGIIMTKEQAQKLLKEHAVYMMEGGKKTEGDYRREWAQKKVKIGVSQKQEEKIDTAMNALRAKGYKVEGVGGSGFIMPVLWKVTRPNGETLYMNKLWQLESELVGHVMPTYTAQKVGSVVGMGTDATEEQIKKLEGMGYTVMQSGTEPVKMPKGQTYKMEPGVTEEHRGSLFKVKFNVMYPNGKKKKAMTVRALDKNHAKQIVGDNLSLRFGSKGLGLAHEIIGVEDKE